MRHQFHRFLSAQSGAVAVDWVVLAAATVGIGLAAAGTVRTGVGSLGGDINTALGGAEIALLCQGQQPEYAVQIFHGERSRNGERIRQQVGEMNDEDLRNAYAETAEKARVLHDGGESADYVAEIVDYAHFMNQEMERRRLETPEGSPSFTDLHTGISGGGGSIGCTGLVANGGGGYQMMHYSDEQIAEISTNMDRADDRELSRAIGDLEQSFREGLERRDAEYMEKVLDHLHLLRAELEERGEDREAIAAAEELWNRSIADYERATA